MPDLISLDELQASAPALAARDDAALLISGASVRISRYCDRTFGPQADIVEKKSGKGTPRLWLDVTPVTAVSSVEVNGSTLSGPYTFDPHSGLIVRGDGRCEPDFALPWPGGLNNVVVTYDGGEDVPADVKLACIALCKWIADRMARSGVVQSEKIGDYQYTLAAGDAASWPSGVLDPLDDYRTSWVV